MSKKLTISFNSDWVLERREDLVLPIAFVGALVRERFNGALEIEDESFTEVIYVVASDADGAKIAKEIKEAIEERYQIKAGDGVLTVNLIDDAKSENAPEKERDERLAKKTLSTLSGFFGTDKKSEDKAEISQEEKEKQQTLEKENEEKRAKEKLENIEKCLNDIKGLVGAEEFKNLASELCKLLPIVEQNKSFETIFCQSYLFSINDGCGLTTYLQALAALFSRFGFDVSNDIAELKIEPSKDGSMEPFAKAMREIERGGRKLKVVCIDISEWMNNTSSHLFKNFLMELQKCGGANIIVFKIPFVDKEVLDRVRKSLNDLVFVRSVSFPPFTKEELRRYAENELNRFGFKMSSGAWECFYERLNEEKSDGKFYGLNTVKKVVRELLYKKQLSNANKGKNDLNITKKDASALCTSVEVIGLSGYEMLDSMIGGQYFKERINEIVSQIELARANPGMQAPCIHMRFVGNPGTGKTTVARIVGKILRERGVLRIGDFHEHAGRDLCGRYIGETAPKTASICRDAYGSVLFIDEAYSLYKGDGDSKDYGREALDTLIAEMENHRTDFVVIMAGYTDDMEKLMQGNAGLASRMPYVIEFPNFTREQLFDIFVSMVKKQFKYDDALFDAAKNYFSTLSDEYIRAKEFSNARFVRNLFERVWAKAAMRCQLAKCTTITLTKEDFERSVSEKEFANINEKKKSGKIGF